MGHEGRLGSGKVVAKIRARKPRAKVRDKARKKRTKARADRIREHSEEG